MKSIKTCLMHVEFFTLSKTNYSRRARFQILIHHNSPQNSGRESKIQPFDSESNILSNCSLRFFFRTKSISPLCFHFTNTKILLRFGLIKLKENKLIKYANIYQIILLISIKYKCEIYSRNVAKLGHKVLKANFTALKISIR